MPFGAQKLFPLKYSVLWKLSFEHFSNCRLSTFLSNQHFLRFFPTVTWGFAYTLLCSRHPEVTYQSCQGISAGVFCTCYSRKRLRSYVLTGLYSLRHRPACPRQIIFDPLDICLPWLYRYNILFASILHANIEPGAPAKTPFHCYLLALF